MRLIERASALFLGIALLSLSGCSTNEKLDEMPDNVGTISFKVATKTESKPGNNSKLPTRNSSKVADAENYIESLQIFFFDEDGVTIWIPQRSNIIYDSASQKVNLLIPSFDIRKKLIAGQVEVHILANHRVERVDSSLDLLKRTVENQNFASNANIDKLIMMGKTKANIKFLGSNNDLSEIPLKRLAAKIQAKYPVLPEGGIPVATSQGKAYYKIVDGKAVEVRLRNLYTQSYLDTQSILSSDLNNAADVKEYSTINKNESNFFYTYPGEWNAQTKGMYLEYKIRMKRSDTKQEENFYYIIPVQYENETQQEYSVLSNHHYIITPTIDRVEASDETNPIQINGKFKITNWSNQDLEVTIDETHYFMVKEHDVVMSNIDRYSVKFVASSNVRVKEIEEVWFWSWEIKEQGKKDLITVQRDVNYWEAGYPQVRVNNQSSQKTIDIYCEVPDNFSPKYIKITLEDENGLEEKLDIVQYPIRYITGKCSLESDKDPNVYYAHDYNNSVGTQSQNNFNVYAITTLAGGTELNGKNYKIGDPSYIKNGKVYTYEDREHNQLISPQFAIASQRSIYDRTMYNRSYSTTNGPILSARERCANYAEAGYGVGTWRLPTEAEIEYMIAIQSNEKSPVKELFNGSKYWSAASYRYYIFQRSDAYDGPVGLFGDYRTPDKYLKNDSYSINNQFIPISNQSNSPVYRAFVDPEGQHPDPNYKYYYSYKFYYSAYVRCVHDI
ncbi:fimbrial protein [Bacteroides propionicifaciens]|uniref:fimbrial tip adhesin FimD n=1 Tax=Bacteroides propionicifaciens TaxID=392838 RepID=UPI000360A6F4|nr:fimbrial protein [Bacteroides propionicifaciens]